MLGTLMLAACRPDPPPTETPLHKAGRHYAFLKEHGATLADLCTAAREAKDAAVDAGDDLAFMEWHNVETQHCQLGQL